MADYATGLADKLRIAGPRTFTGTGTITMLNEGVLVVKKAVGAATAVTLPKSPSPGDFAFIKDGKADAATNNITITPASGNVDGAANYVISENSGCVLLHYSGTEWGVVSQTNAVSAAEFAFVNGVVAGTGAAGKALVLDSSGNVTMPAAPAAIDERNAEVVATTNIILAAENGRTYYLNAAGGFTSTLPVPALGLRFRFVVKTAPTTTYVITTNAGANLIFGMFEERAGGAGVAGATQDTVNLVGNQAIIGDWAEFESDGTNWYVRGMVNIAAGVTFAVT